MSSPPSRSHFDNVFSSHRPLFSLSEKVWNPPADVYETTDSLDIKMEIAGVCLDTLHITTQQNQLTIQGQRCEDAALRKENFHLMELRYGQFERSFPLPDHFQTDNVSARYNDGFLIVTIPKSASKKRIVPIEITRE